jgi:hypothetical protein
MFLYKSTYKRWNRLDNKQYIHPHLFSIAKSKGHDDSTMARMAHYLMATSFVVLVICCRHPYLHTLICCALAYIFLVNFIWPFIILLTSLVLVLTLHCVVLLLDCAGLFPWSMQLQPPCFEPPTHRCTDGRSCVFVCQYNGIKTYRAYCVIPTNPQEPYKCCCPP